MPSFDETLAAVAANTEMTAGHNNRVFVFAEADPALSLLFVINARRYLRITFLRCRTVLIKSVDRLNFEWRSINLYTMLSLI